LHEASEQRGLRSLGAVDVRVTRRVDGARLATARQNRFRGGIFRELRDRRPAFEGDFLLDLGDHPDAVHLPRPVEPPVSSDNFSLSVEVCLVRLRRPWLSESFLQLRSWFVPGTAKGEFSSGMGATDAGRLAVLPIACVFIRNLTMKAQWSEADQTNVENASHLGAFSLLGRTYDRNNGSLTVPGTQGLAWICDPLPVLPPSDPRAT
jgi:hypothetical protein